VTARKLGTLVVAASSSLIMTTLAFAEPVQAAEPACGPEIAGVHQVSTVAQLQAIGSGGDCLRSDDYRQVADITLPAPVAPATSNFTPIGNSTLPFTGTFDGGDYSIRGLVIDIAGNSIGLFGYTDRAVLRNVHMVDANVIGGAYVGALAGYVYRGSTVTDSSSTGTVSGTSYVGGLIGAAVGQSGEPVSVTRLMSAATVTATGREIGGLLGSVTNGFTLSGSYATGTVTGDEYVGGLSGSCCSAFTQSTVDSFASGKATATGFGAASLFGAAFNDQTYTRLYGTGVVSAPSNKGGLVGSVSLAGTWNNSFWNSSTTTATTALGNGSNPAGTTGRTSEQLRDIATFSGAGWDISAGVNDDSVWGIDPALNDGFPFLSWSVRDVTYNANGGLGSVPSDESGLVWQDITVGSSSGLSRDGFTFTAWNTRADGSGQTVAPGDSFSLPWSSHGDDTSVTTMFAQWSVPAPPDPPAPTPAPAPRDVVAVAGNAAVSVSWLAPSSSGSFPVTNYQVSGSPSGSCVVPSAVVSCSVTGLRNGVAYSFRVRALTGAGWGAWSAPVSVVPHPPEPARSILITGAREGRSVVVTGVAPELAGEQVTPWLRFPGPGRYRAGAGVQTVSADGAFTWQRATSKKTYVYFRAGETRSNSITIPRSGG
jgi:hypothetical protein